jgi:hypothetical protein
MVRVVHERLQLELDFYLTRLDTKVPIEHKMMYTGLILGIV